MRDYFLLFCTFLRFGFLAWGGPVAQIAMLKEQLVDREQWITQEKFRKALAVYQALPGPEAHELCVYFGMLRKGRLGGLLAGLGFMLPGLLFMLSMAWLYKWLGMTALLPLLAGVKPAVSALIVRAVYKIGSHTLQNGFLIGLSAAAFISSLYGVHFLYVLAFCGLGHMLWIKGKKVEAFFIAALVLAAGIMQPAIMPFSGVSATAGGSVDLFTEGLKAGLLSFGGAYTTIPFLQDSLVTHHRLLSTDVFLDGIALGNVIPAPLVIFGTFLGYMIDGLPGALWITAGIFLPAFCFTLLGHGWLEKIIEYPPAHALLEGIAAGVVGIFGVAALQIVLATLTGVDSIILFAINFAVLIYWKSRWAVPALILLSGFAGFLLLQ